jgi:hypothetical protein
MGKLRGEKLLYCFYGLILVPWFVIDLVSQKISEEQQKDARDRNRANS